MKRISLAAAISLLAGSAIAGANEFGWDGFYGGLQVANLEGASTFDYSFDDINDNGPWLYDGTVQGGFAGFNLRNENLVIGAEISLFQAEVWAVDGSFIDGILDAKARIGWATGPFVVYGVAAYSSLSMGEEYALPARTQVVGSGFGGGVELVLRDEAFVGLEYLNRNVSGQVSYNPDWDLDVNVSTLSLRLGFNF